MRAFRKKPRYDFLSLIDDEPAHFRFCKCHTGRCNPEILDPGCPFRVTLGARILAFAIG